MSQSYSSNSSFTAAVRRGFTRPWILLFALPLWVYIGFNIGGYLTQLFIWLLSWLGVPLVQLSDDLFNTLTAVVVYAFTLLIVIGGPWLVLKRRTSRADVGLQRLPEWFDFLMAPAGFIVYFVLSGALLVLVTNVFPSFNPVQAQDTGFAHLSMSYQYILAFITLVVLAPLCEELLFRGYLFGKLRKIVPLWVAILFTSLLFGFLHVHGGTWNVGLDTFALSIILCLLRVYTGSLWASILLHMIKNAIAYYLLFINPS